MEIIDRIFELADEIYPDQKSFAAAVGVSDKVVSTWRTGRNRSYMKPENLTKISNALNTDVAYITSGNENKGSPPSEGDELLRKLLKCLSSEEKRDMVDYARFLISRRDDP